MQRRRFLAALTVLAAGRARAAQDTPAPEIAAPYVPSPTVIVHEILSLARVGANDTVADLGSGDGRLVIEAVTRYGARGGFGVDIDAELVARANANAAKAGVADRVRFEQRDLFATDVRAATVVTVYLLPKVMERLERKLRAELQPGARVVCHDYPFPNWRPTQVVEREFLDKIPISGVPHTILYLYEVPPR
jgi:cyclopropane fatty-acyl-phospholipid synthase-like methyltransferase